jgi:hypothetical protein
MTPRDEILLEAGVLQVAQSMRVVCPFCHGGEAAEDSLSISRTGEGVLYNCHRASCGERGFIGTNACDLGAQSQPTPLSKVQPYRGELLPLESKDTAFFLSRYELPTSAILERIKRNERDEYVLPIVWQGKERGFNVRQPWDGAPRKGRAGVPKSKVWMHSIKPVQSLYTTDWADTPGQFGDYSYQRPLVIVEDQLSAIKASAANIAYAVALIGTHLNPERVREIALLRPDEVIIALDADATATAFDHARKYGLAFRKTRVAILEQDIKDTPMKDIARVLGI